MRVSSFLHTLEVPAAADQLLSNDLVAVVLLVGCTRGAKSGKDQLVGTLGRIVGPFWRVLKHAIFHVFRSTFALAVFPYLRFLGAKSCSPIDPLDKHSSCRVW